MQKDLKLCPTIINDPVHGHIELDPLYMKIINTPQFQRLRFLKQLGFCSFVFPGAVHTRFEHSIGVCHLAENLCKTLQQKQPELNITDNDIKCVAIAGLCHDLGHGPFSHFFEKKFISKFNKDWKHEDGSIQMFDFLINENHLESFISPEDQIFIKEQIHLPNHEKDSFNIYKGRGSEKYFLYEIVANKRNGIDVDKWDYIARDCHYLGIKTAFDHNRLMKFVRVMDVGREKQICTRAKEVDNLYQLFHSRACLHKQAYLHKTSLIIDYMSSRAFVEANDYLLIEGQNGERYKLSDTVKNMSAYLKVTDDIFNKILYSTEDNLKIARRWLEKILLRQLPKVVGILLVEEQKHCNEEWLRNGLKEQAKLLGAQLLDDDIIILKRKIDYGMKESNPIDSCWFYGKRDIHQPYRVKKNQVSSFLPDKFKEVQYIIFCNSDDIEKINVARECHKMMCQIHKVSECKGTEESCIFMSPLKRTNEDLSDNRTSEVKRRLMSN